MVATIYNTSLLVKKKSGTSVDVKVDVKNVTEGREGGDQAKFVSTRILEKGLKSFLSHSQQNYCPYSALTAGRK